MAAYLIADMDVTDAAGYEDYKKSVGASIAAFGGRYLARGGESEVLEGAWQPKRLVIVEFPTLERLRAWYASPAYAPVLALRKRCANSQLVTVDGVPGA